METRRDDRVQQVRKGRGVWNLRKETNDLEIIPHGKFGSRSGHTSDAEIGCDETSGFDNREATDMPFT